MVLSRAIPLAAVACLVLLPAAAAQDQADSVLTISLPASVSVGTVKLGTSGQANVQVGLTAKNIVCTQASTATVTLTVNEPSPVPGVVPVVAPLTVTFTLPQGPTGAGAASPPLTASSPMPMVNVTVTANAPANHAHNFTLTATSALGANCNPINPTLKHDPVSGTVTLTTGPALGNATSTTTSGTGSPTGGNSGTTSKASPLADVPTVALIMVGAALLASRRRVD